MTVTSNEQPRADHRNILKNTEPETPENQATDLGLETSFTELPVRISIFNYMHKLNTLGLKNVHILVGDSHGMKLHPAPNEYDFV